MDFSSPFSHHFCTNYVPDKEEIVVIKELINGRQVVVDGIDEEIAELDQRREALLEKRQAEVAHIDNHCALISPARRLHPDIILSIFLELISTFTACNHYHRPPAITLSQVCHQWRCVALSSPLVWAHIPILVRPYPVKPRETPTHDELKAYDKRLSQWMNQMDGLCAMADAFVARSQGCPLHIEFAAGDPVAQDHAEALSAGGGWRRVMKPLMNIATMCPNEWKSLTLILRISSASESLLSDMLQLLPALKRRALQVLKLDVAYQNMAADIVPWGATQGQIDVQQAPLTSLTLLMPYDVLNRISAQWDKLVSLSIGSSHGGVIFGPQEAILVLAITPNIVFCAIKFDGDSDVAQMLYPQQQTVALHRLRKLDIVGPVLHNDFSALLDTPSLSHLSVIYPCASPYQEDRSAIIDWVQRYGEQLTHVALSYSYLTQSGLAYVLEHLPMVESLSLQGNERKRSLSVSLISGPPERKLPTILDSTILQRFTPKSVGTSEDLTPPEHCICPKLRTFTCKLEEGHGERMKDLFVDMVEARRKVNRRDGPVAWIEKVDVTFITGPVDWILEDLRQREVETWAEIHGSIC